MPFFLYLHGEAKIRFSAIFLSSFGPEAQTDFLPGGHVRNPCFSNLKSPRKFTENFGRLGPRNALFQEMGGLGPCLGSGESQLLPSGSLCLESLRLGPRLWNLCLERGLSAPFKTGRTPTGACNNAPFSEGFSRLLSRRF